LPQGSEYPIATGLAYSREVQEAEQPTTIGNPGGSLDRKGSFRNVTVMSGITGFGLHLGIIDDPVKGRMDAQTALEDAADQVYAKASRNFFRYRQLHPTGIQGRLPARAQGP
jgi:hypothetical protein